MKKQKSDPEEEALNKKIETQNKEYFKLRDQLERETKKSDHIAILEANKQVVPEGNAEVNNLHKIEMKINIFFINRIVS